jgi:prolipoprotein diacylglyceryltransferase
VHLAVGYELVMDLVIFAWLVWLARGFAKGPDGRWHFNWQPRLPRDGMLFWAYLCVYSLGRFVIQFYRQDTQFALGLSQAQLLSVLTAMVAIWMLVFQYNRARKRGPSTTNVTPTHAASPG